MNDNIRQIEDNTEETLGDARVLLSNLDDILVHKYLKPSPLNIKKRKELQEDDMIPVSANSMFKTMIYNGNRIRYSKETLKYILPRKYRNFTLLKSEIDKNTYEDKEMIVDFAAISKDLIINIEMNGKNTLERNANYLYELCSKEIKKGSKYEYMKGLQVNLNQFNPPHNKIMSLHYMRDRVGDVYLPQIFVNIYLQNLWEMYYNVSVEELSEFERWILVMTSRSKKEAEKLAGGDELMKEYIKDAKDAMTNDKSLREAYDREVELYEIALEEGAENGREEGAEKKCIEIATNLLKSGMTVEFIHENTKLPIDEIKKLKNSFSKEVME